MVEKIGYSAFVNCSNLKNVTLPSKLTPESYSGTLDFSGTAITELTVPNGICDFNANGCANLKKLTIANTVAYIPYGALDGCVLLEEIYYEGTVSQWEKVMQETNGNWSKDVLATVVVCADGEAII